MKLFNIKIIGFIALLNLSCIEDKEDINVLDTIEYQWWRLEQANLFITEDACFYIDPKNLYLYIHFLDSGNYWTYNLEYDSEKKIFNVLDTSFSFWFLQENNDPEVIVKFGVLQKRSDMKLCYGQDTYSIRANVNNPFFVTYPICE